MKLHPFNMGASIAPNFYGVLGCLCALLAVVVWPHNGDVFQKIFGGLLGWFAVLSFVHVYVAVQRNGYRRKALYLAQEETDTHGKGRFATFDEINDAGLFDIGVNPYLVGIASYLPLCLPKQICVSLCAMRGSGKSSAIFSPTLLQSLQTGSSCIMQDIKGEFYALWAEALTAMGFRVYVSNLADDETYPVHDSNPYAPLIEAIKDRDQWPFVFVMAESLSRALIKDAVDAKSQFFKNGDRAVHNLAAVGLALFHPERCTPSGVYRTILNPDAFYDLLLECKHSAAFQGDLHDLACYLLTKRDDAPEHFENFCAGAANALALYKPSSKLGKLGTINNFDIATLRDPGLPPAVVFVVFPGEQVSVYGAANALTMTSWVQKLRMDKAGRHVMLLIDEATAAPFNEAVEIIEHSRSWNLDLMMGYQSPSSLEKLYGKEDAQSICDGSVELFFGVSSLTRAKEISERIGKHTIKSTSYSFSEVGAPSLSLSEQAKDVMPSEEILAMPKDQGILLYPNLRPIKFRKASWYELKPHKDWAGANPHEQGHGRSPITHFEIEYSGDANNLKPPRLKDVRARRKLGVKQHKKEARPKSRLKRPLLPFRLRDFVWLPLVLVIGFAMNEHGTPHVLFDSVYIRASGDYSCAYYGLSGFRRITQATPCRAFQNLPFTKF